LILLILQIIFYFFVVTLRLQFHKIGIFVQMFNKTDLLILYETP